ncbi:Sodium/hydrogen exchanger family-domain-containing protein [Aspergillus multicolor]|uniref:Sodium/hydrogen exchanger family-domain-containing protein n=1 Tax=Aspergillus multicolor TaxID=41759 RepID=UPI003CCCAD20
MPTLNVSELNVVISVLGAFIVLYALASVKIKNHWYLGEALPALLIGIILGPSAARFLDASEWGTAVKGQQDAITLGLCRVVIGVQLVIVGFQLPAEYQLHRWKEMLICLLPNMALMWLSTSACILLAIPRLDFLSALVLGSQLIAKGPFADRYVARDLREIISSEAGANDGFGFPFLMLATYLLRYTQGASTTSSSPELNHDGLEHRALDLVARAGDVGHQEGGLGKAMQMWVVETWCYYVIMGAVYGAVVGYASMRALRFALKRRWIDGESYLLFPTALGLFTLGTCGLISTNDLLACFTAGTALNWDGAYLAETEARHDEVNPSIDVLLNFAGFMYIGAVMPWADFHQPDTTGITYARLILLGVLVLLFRRIPSLLALWRFMPKVCKGWKEALFMGYFGPIGIGGVFYAEHASHLFPHAGEGSEMETTLIQALKPTIYFLVLFSIVIHGLSIPLLSIIYRMFNVPHQIDPLGPAEIRPLSRHAHLPPNSTVDNKQRSILMYNRFSRSKFPSGTGMGVTWALGLPHFTSGSERDREESRRRGLWGDSFYLSGDGDVNKNGDADESWNGRGGHGPVGEKGWGLGGGAIGGRRFEMRPAHVVPVG